MGLGRDITSETNKLAWRCHFESQSSPLPFLKSKRSYPYPSCPHLSNPDFRRWAQSFRTAAIRAAVGLSNSCGHANNFGLLRLGIKCIRRLPYFIMPNDKQPGYSLVPYSVLDQVEVAALKSPLYMPICWEYISVESLITQYRSLAFRIGHFHEDKQIADTIRSSLSEGLFCSLLGLTCKTHKPEYDVGVRTIHRGIKLWLVQVLKPLVTREFLVKDSRAFSKAVCQASVTQSSRMCAVDLKDFYLSGDPFTIAADVSSAFEGILRTLVRESIFFLLDNQYIISQQCGSFFKCCKGSGIGLLHSGHLTSALYVITVEDRLVRLSPFLNRGIIVYTRYHDDIFYVARSRACMKVFFRALSSSNSQTFIHECRSVGSHAKHVEHLDVTVSFVGSSICVIPTQGKPITPLCPSSGHAPHVHFAWPRGVVNRMCDLTSSTSEQTLSSVCNKLVGRYNNANAHPYTVQILESACAAVLKPLQPAPQCIVPKKVGALVLHYHPVFRHALAHAFRIAPPPSSLGFRIVIAWKNQLPSIASYISVCNRNISDLGIREREGVLFLCTSDRSCNIQNIVRDNLKPSVVLAIHNLAVIQQRPHR